MLNVYCEAITKHINMQVEER